MSLANEAALGMVIGQTSFSVLVWSAIFVVLGVFIFIVIALLREANRA